MLTCDKCRAALLDHQYGLLDAADAAAVDAHVAACPACRAEQATRRAVRPAALGRRPEPTSPTCGSSRRRIVAAGRGRGSRPRTPLLGLRHWPIWAVAAASCCWPSASRPGRTSYSEPSATTSSPPPSRGRTTWNGNRATPSPASTLQRSRGRCRRPESQDDAQAAKSTRVGEVGRPSATAGQAAQFRRHRPDDGPGRRAGRVPHPDVATPPASRRRPRSTYRGQGPGRQGRLGEATPCKAAAKSRSRCRRRCRSTPNRDLYPRSRRPSGPTAPKAELREELKLATPVYVTHLTTDKPLYQPGEIVRFRSLTLDRASLKPAAEPLTIQFVVRDPLGAETPIVAGATSVPLADGKPVVGPDGKPVRGIGAGEWTIPPTAAGGEYTLAVREAERPVPGGAAQVPRQPVPGRPGSTRNWNGRASPTAPATRSSPTAR